VLYLSRGILASGDPSEAAEVLTLMGDPQSWQSFPDLRECYAYASFLLNELPEAEKHFRALLEEDQSNQFARVGLMRILAGREAWEELASHAESLHAAAPTEKSAALVERLTGAGMIRS